MEDPCAYKHEDTENIIEMLQKECLAANVKIAKLIEDIDYLNAKEKESEDIIENLKQIENSMKKQNEKIQTLENKSKDTDLKIVEQNKEMDILKKKLRILKEKESKVVDLEKN